MFFYFIEKNSRLFGIQTYPFRYLNHICSSGKRIVVDGSGMVVSCCAAWQQVVSGSESPSLIVDEGEILGVVVAVAY